MSGGRLVVLDLQGRDVKYYPLNEGLATLGSDPICDIRFLLPTVSAHHATVSVHTNQCVVHAVGTDPTLVNGTVVSVAALRHGDEISVGGRRLRWEYNDPSQKRVTPVVNMPALARRSTGKRNTRRRVTTGSGKSALVPPLRASTGALDWHSGNASSPSSGKQVAIVQPWGKDTNNENDSITTPATKRKRRRSLPLDDSADLEEPPKKRWATLGGGDSATKASLWCESRRAPRRTPLKIHDPPGVDHTKQAALMLMTGHTPKPKETPRATPRRKRVSGTKRRTRQGQPTPRLSRAREGPHSISLLEIGPVSRRSEGSSRTERSNFLTSPILGSPKKSAMKDPTARKSTRKTESIKFDLSNLDGHERSSDLIMFDNTEKDDYSESSVTMSPSPKKNLRSSKILDKSLRSSNTINTLSPRHISSQRSTLEATAPTLGRSPKKSLWESIILKKALENSRAASKSRDSDQSYATAQSPGASIRQTETYTEVDLVSLDSDSSRSVYDSTESFESPQSIITSQSDRKTRSGKPYLLATSTPYHGKAKGSPRDLESDKETSRNKTRGRSLFSDTSSTGKKPSLSIVSVRSESNQTNVSDKSKKTTRRSASLTTPKNSYWSLSLNSTKATRASKSRSRINDSDLLLLDDDDDASPRSSRRRSGATPRKNISIVAESSSSDGAKDGCVTPENEHSPKDAGTPVLNIQNLLDQSLDRSIRVRNSRKRKTIGHIRSVKRPNVARAKSFTQTRSKKMDSSNDEDGIITPTSDVQLVPESVKNKHSTAKKPQSKRSLIDTLDESDVVKQLFSSPVKRNLSRSMSDFNWQDDEKPVTRHTIALTGRSLNTSGLSVLHDSAHIAPEVFVSPLGTPNVSPNLSGVKRLFARRTRNDLSDVRGVKGLLKTPRARRSIVNDLTRVSGVKKTFARSPKNRLSDVRVKELFVPSPKNDLRRVSGVKSLFQSVETRQMASPNVENIRGLFKRIPRNELVNVSGVTALKRRSPRNDLTDVEGIDQLYEEPAAGDMSGLELLQEQEDADSTFDRLLGKPKLKSYGKSKSMTIFSNAKQKRAAKSLHDSIDAINTNVEEWLQGQLQKSSSKRNSGNARELQKLSTATVEGAAPVLTSRSRSSIFAKDQSTLFDVSKRTSKGELSRSKAEKSRNSKAEASLSKSKRQSNETSQSKSVAPATLQLPIKKRVGVHSTPVKGVHATLNTTALACISPINAKDLLTKTSMATLNEPKKPAGKSKRSLQKQLPEIVVTANNSPKKVEAKNKTRTPIQPPTTRRKAAEISKRLLQKQLPEIVVTANNSPKKVEAKNETRTPIQPPTTRRKAAETKLSTVIKRRKSITITKKPPVLSPKPVKQVSEKPASPKRARSTSNKVEEKRKTPAKISKRLLQNQLPEIVVTANNSPKTVEAKNKIRTPIQPPTTRRKAAEISKRLLQEQLPEIVVTANNSPKKVEAKNKTRTPIQPPITRRKAAEISKRLLQEQLPEIVTANNSPKKVEAKNKTRTPIQPPITRRKAAEISKRLLQKQLPEIVVTANNSPKKVEAKNETRTPIQPPTTRRKPAETKLSTVIKRRKSITITKKPPVLSPKPVKQVSEKPASPKRARSTRNKVEEKRKTPAKSRAKARRISVVVSKPSPRLKPKSATPAKGTNRTRRTKVVEEPPKETQTRQSRKTKATENVSNASKKTKIEVEKSVEKQPAKSSTRKTQIVEKIAKETEVKTARRGRKTQEIKNIEEPSKRSPKTINSKVEDKNTSKKSPIKSPVKLAQNRSRRGQTNVTNVEVSNTYEEPKPKRGRKTETTTEIVEVKKGRKTRAIESVATETAPKRATTAKAEVVTEAKPVRGRKTAATEPKEEPKGRRSEKVAIVEETIEVTQKGRLTKTQSTSEDKNTSKKGGKQKAESPAPKGRDITRNAVKVEPSTGRGKKATNASANKTAPASTTDRKRKSNEPVAKEELRIRSTRSGRRY